MSWPGRVGWCPSVVTPMAAHDGLLVRVKPTAATVPSPALRAIAEAAEACGNGLIDLTNRGNLQIRGLRPETAEAFADVVRAHGLASTEPAIEEIRNVAADPLGNDDPDAVFNSHALARAIEAMLADEPALKSLPPKFGFLVDCGRAMRMPDAHADIVVREQGGTLTIGLGGGSVASPCAPEEVPDLARRLALAFFDLAGSADAPTFRMRELVKMVGEDAILARAGFAAAAVWAPDQVRGANQSEFVRMGEDGTGGRQKEPRVPDLIRDSEAARGTPGIDPARAAHLALMYAPAPAGSPVGYVAFPGRDTGAVVAGAPRGRVEASALTALASLCERYADGTIRMTPWRALALAPVDAAAAPALLAALAALGLITDPTDPRRHLRGPDIDPASGPLVRPEAIVP